MPSIVLDMEDGKVTIRDVFGSEIVSWLEQEWLADSSVVYAMLGAVDTGLRMGADSLRDVISHWPERSMYQSVSVGNTNTTAQTFTLSGSALVSTDATFPFSHLGAFPQDDDSDDEDDDSGDEDDQILGFRWSPNFPGEIRFNNVTLPINHRQLMNDASAALNNLMREPDLSGVYNTGGNIWCIVVAVSPAMEFIVGDSDEHAWGLSVLDAMSGERLGSRLLRARYTDPVNALVTELQGLIITARTPGGDLGLDSE